MLTAEAATSLYQKLAPFLEVVKGDGNPMREPWGCYPPKRHGRNKLEDWPLSAWRGPGSSPLCVKWQPNATRQPTFEQFCRLYRLNPVTE